MGKRKKKPEELIDEYIADLRNERSRWDKYKQAGTTDRIYPDGVGMNLTRNHCIYDVNRIKKLCEEIGAEIPSECYEPLPPKVDQNFMVDPESERAKRIFAFYE